MGLHMCLSLTNHRVVLYDISENQLNKALKTIEENLKRQFKKGVITEDQIKNTITNITTTANLNDLSDIDFCVEASPENEQLKFELFRKLDEITRNDIILASNTSSIPITRIAFQTKA